MSHEAFFFEGAFNEPRHIWHVKISASPSGNIRTGVIINIARETNETNEAIRNRSILVSCWFLWVLQEECELSFFLCRTFAPSNRNNGEKIAAPRGKIYGPTGKTIFEWKMKSEKWKISAPQTFQRESAEKALVRNGTDWGNVNKFSIINYQLSIIN